MTEGMTARKQADFLVRELFVERFGDVPFDPGRPVDQRMSVVLKALQRLELSDPEQTRLMRDYMNLWDDPTYGGLARYLTHVIVKHRKESL